MTNAAACPSNLLDVRAFPESAMAFIKVYKAASEGEGRYSPAEVASVEVVPAMDQPDPDRICTSIVERQNLTIRMQMRPLTRLTNAFQQEVGKPVVRVLPALRLLQLLPDSQELRVTPAMEPKLTDHVWDLEGIA